MCQNPDKVSESNFEHQNLISSHNFTGMSIFDMDLVDIDDIYVRFSFGFSHEKGQIYKM